MFRKSVLLNYIPNSITCCNLFAGCMSIVAAFNGLLPLACYFIFAAAIFDFFDGFFARWLHAYSEIGKELDSLADMVSFGVAPATIMYLLLLNATSLHGFSSEIFSSGWFLSIPAFVIAVFSALRLAKFNIDTRQTDSFIGLPTPANTLFICSLVFIIQGKGYFSGLAGNMYFLLAVVVIFSWLLIAELPLFSLKFKSFDWKNNRIRYIFIVLSVVILLFLRWSGLAFVILTYILLSIIVRITCKKAVF